MPSLTETQAELWFFDRGPVILKILSAAQEGEADQKKGDKWGEKDYSSTGGSTHSNWLY